MASLFAMMGTAEKKVEEAAQEASEALAKAATEVEEQVSAVAHQVEDRVLAAERAMEQAGAQFLETMRTYLHGKITVVIKAVSGALPFAVKKVLDDPEMPEYARRVKDRAVDIAWPEVQEQIALEMEHGLTDMRDALKELAGQPDPDDEKPGCCCPVAFVRYHLYPYDRGLWGVSQDPFWLLAVILTLIPIFSVSSFLFPIVFLFIDKTDEFQLLFFIVQVKGIQFISHGILQVYVSFFQFIRCSLSDTYTCKDKQLAGEEQIVVDMLGYVLIFLMMLTAYAMVYLLSKKRKPKRGSAAVAEDVPSTFRGGNMLYLICYDMVLTAIGVAVMLAVLSSSDWDFTEARVGFAAEAIKVVHGFFMLPFFVMLVVPILRNVILHTRPTGYDRKGSCRNYVGPAGDMPKATEVIPKMELFNKEEAEELLQQLKKSLMGGFATSKISA